MLGFWICIAVFSFILILWLIPDSSSGQKSLQEDSDKERTTKTIEARPKNISEPVTTIVRLYKENPSRFKGVGALLDRSSDYYSAHGSLWFKFVVKDLDTGTVYKMTALKGWGYPEDHHKLYFGRHFGEDWLTQDEQDYINSELKSYIKEAIEEILYNRVNKVGKKFHKQTSRREELIKLYCGENV